MTAPTLNPTPADVAPVLLDQGLAAAVDGIVHCALERAGHGLWRRQPRSARPPKIGGCRAAAFHITVPVTLDMIERWRLLDGAWDRVPEIAARYRVDPVCLAATLDDYCRGLLTSGVAHEWRLVAPLLRAPCLVGVVV